VSDGRPVTPLTSRRLGALLALASRPGTPAEGAAARRHAERLAARNELLVVQARSGELVVMDELQADLLRALERIAAGRAREEIDG
jgi:hypothetical protein